MKTGYSIEAGVAHAALVIVDDEAIAWASYGVPLADAWSACSGPEDIKGWNAEP